MHLQDPEVEYRESPTLTVSNPRHVDLSIVHQRIQKSSPSPPPSSAPSSTPSTSLRALRAFYLTSLCPEAPPDLIHRRINRVGMVGDSPAWILSPTSPCALSKRRDRDVVLRCNPIELVLRRRSSPRSISKGSGLETLLSVVGLRSGH